MSLKFPSIYERKYLKFITDVSSNPALGVSIFSNRTKQKIGSIRYSPVWTGYCLYLDNSEYFSQKFSKEIDFVIDWLNETEGLK